MNKTKENFKSIKTRANNFIKQKSVKYGLTVFHIIMAIVLFIKAIKKTEKDNSGNYKKDKFEFIMGFIILIFGTAYGVLLILGNSN